MKQSVAVLLSAALFAATPAVVRAQLGSTLPISLEVRGGGAFPTGEFADDEPGVGAEPGPHLGIAVAWSFSRAVSLQGGYSRSVFGCGGCGNVGIDDEVVDDGFDAGLELRLPRPLAGVTPWVGVAGLLHQLAFSGDASTLTSNRAAGFRLSAGVAVPLLRSVAVKPGVSYSAYSAELDLGASGNQTVDVRAIAADVGLAYHF